MYKIEGIRTALDEELTVLHIAKKAGTTVSNILSYKILKKAVDARKKNDVHFVYSVGIETRSKLKQYSEIIFEEYRFPKSDRKAEKPPVVVGSGPAGLFAALMLAESGHRPVLIERGADIDTRTSAVKKFWESGALDVRTNVQFGEGGAGTFSDGKLNTGIHDTRCRFVLETFAKYGAPEEITYVAKPHIGTDILSGVVKNIRKRIVQCGGEVRFLTCMTGIKTVNNKVCAVEAECGGERYTIDTDSVILAIGHSARDTYKMLRDAGVFMEQKNFSVGVRIEHRQEMINESQYGGFAKLLGAADYKLAAHFEDGRSAYTFCMCPGGLVVASNSEEGTVVTNGMSLSARDGKNANSALLVNVTTEDFESEDVLAGVDFQEKIEKKAFAAGGRNYCAPCQYVGDFMGYEVTQKVEPTYRPGVTFCELADIFPEFVINTLKKSLCAFDKKIKGFASGGALLTAPETRSSSPVRIVRKKDTFTANIDGLYPCGEGAGYAGGIMSAAVDGIKVSEAVAGRYNI